MTIDLLTITHALLKVLNESGHETKDIKIWHIGSTDLYTIFISAPNAKGKKLNYVAKFTGKDLVDTESKALLTHDKLKDFIISNLHTPIQIAKPI
jgi:hypothetical protein